MLTAAVQSTGLHRPVQHRRETHLWTGQRSRRRSLSHRSHHRTSMLRTMHWLRGCIAGELLDKQQIPGTSVPIYCETSTGKPRPYVPAPLRLQVFQSVHDLSHTGTKATAKLVAQRFVWPGVQKDCRTWARACLACQRSKVSRHSYASGRLHAACSPFSAHPYRPSGPSPNINRLPVLPNCGRPLHAIARSHPHPRHHSRNRGTCPL
jgi:hypothetical protein